MLSELCALCERKTYPRLSSVFYFSQKDTEEQNTQHSTETLSQPISQNVTANRGLTPSPSPNGEGSDHRDTPTFPPYVKQLISYHQQTNRGNPHTTPLSIRRGAGGEASVNSVCRRRSVSSKLYAKRFCKICEFCERKKYPS